MLVKGAIGGKTHKMQTIVAMFGIGFEIYLICDPGDDSYKQIW